MCWNEFKNNFCSTDFADSLTRAKVWSCLDDVSVEASIIPTIFWLWSKIGLAKQESWQCSLKKCSPPATIDADFVLSVNPNPFVPLYSSFQTEPGITTFLALLL